MQYIPVVKRDLEDVDYLVRIGRGRQSVKTPNDWVVIGKLFEFWTRRWPHEWQEFSKTIKLIKQTRKRKTGVGDAGLVKYVAALPPRFERLIKVIFPFQQFDKKFIYSLSNRIKIVKVGERNDAWFLV